jgi:hypothetical protein
MLWHVYVCDRNINGTTAAAIPALRPSTVKSSTSSAAVSGKEAWCGSTGGSSAAVPLAAVSVPARNCSLLDASGACRKQQNVKLASIHLSAERQSKGWETTAAQATCLSKCPLAASPTARSAGDTWTHMTLRAYSAHNTWGTTAAMATQEKADLM